MRAVPDDEPFAPPDAALRDPERLAALGATGLSAERPSEVLDHVARVAARLLDAPVALISLVDDERQVFAGRASERGPIGTRRQTPLSHSLCQYVVADGAPVVVADAVHDRRTRDHPAVRDLEVRAYAGVPLTTADGVTLGVLCAIDDAPHAWAPDDVARLRELASVAAAELRRRIAEAALHESQERLALIFARAAVGLSEVGPDGRFLRVNDELCRIVGHTPGEMAQLTVADVTHPDDVPRSVNAVAAVLAEGGSVRLEKRYRRPDGSLVSAESVVTRLDGGAGGERTLLAVTADLTARRQAETALRESEARFRQLADNVSEMFWLLELGPTLLESRVIYMNPAYTRVTGRAREEVYAAPVLGMAHVAPEDRPRVLETAQAVADGEPRTVEYRLTTAAGAERVVRSRMFPIRDDEGRVVRIGGFTEDVTEQRSLEARLRQAQKMEAVGQLAGGVAHDFNNLLTVIAANLEFARDDLGPGHPVQEELAGIAEAAERARALVRQLLSFSSKQPVHPRPVQVDALVRGAERLLRRVIGEEISLVVHVGAGPLVVHADPGQLEQVLLNLAVNARDAMRTPRHGHPGTGGVLTIAVDAVDGERRDAAAAGAPTGDAPVADAGPGGTPHGAWVRLVVGDTGHGMTAGERAHAFEPFFTTKAVGQGTGLGLATVFGIVSQAGGTIGLDSAPGTGTTFTIHLPAADPARRTGAAGASTAARTEGGLPDAPPGGAVVGDPAPEPSPHRTVMLVEDEAPVRRAVRRLLERLGYAVLEAGNGVVGLQVWTAHRDAIDAVVTDLRMPELGGAALAERLRAECAELPIVFMSGYADEAVDAGSDVRRAFLAKPFSADALEQALAAVLPRHPEAGAH